MRDVLLTFPCQIGFLLPFLILAGLFSKKVEVKYFFLALFLMFIDYLLLIFARKVPGLQSLHLHYNWIGKIASLGLSMSIFFLSSTIRSGSGLTWKMKPWSGKLLGLLLGILAVAGLFIGAMNEKEAFSFEAFGFQLFIPSLDEEFFFRGILLYLFSQAFIPSAKFKSAHFGAALVVTGWFAIVHAVMWKGGNFQFDPMVFLVVGVVGAILVALRMISGSLLLPIAGHSIFNVLIQVVKVLG